MKFQSSLFSISAFVTVISSASPAWSAEYNPDTNVVSNAHFEVNIGEMGNLNEVKGEFIDGISYAIDYWSGLFGHNYLDRGKVTIDFGAHSGGSAANSASNQILLSDPANGEIKKKLSDEERMVNGKMVGTYSSAELLLKHGIDVDQDSAYKADMTITFNSSLWENFATNVSGLKYFDLPSMIIHEMAHGLGVNRGGIVYSSALGQLFVTPNNISTWEAMYNVDDFESIEIGSQITIGDPSLGLEVYNPLDYDGGSQFIHILDTSDPDGLMWNYIDAGIVRREFSEKELALFESMGWKFVPEPSSSFLFLLTLPALLFRRRRMRG